MQNESRIEALLGLIRRAGVAPSRIIADFGDERQLLESLEQRMFLSADFPGASVEFRNDEVLSVVYADFDGDNLLDAAVTLDQDKSSSGRILVLKGRGDTSFGEVLTNKTISGENAYEIVAGDFNNDGAADLAAVADDFFAVALNDGSGALGAWLIGGQGNGDGDRSSDDDYGDDDDGAFKRGTSIAAGDIDGDGNTDLAIGAKGGDVRVFTGLGNGSFTFASGFDVNPGSNSSHADVRDLELVDTGSDGNLDIVTATGKDNGNSHPSRVSVWQGNGDGTFNLSQNLATPSRPVDVELTDINGDEIADLVALNDPNPKKGDQQLTIFLGKGAGKFDAGQSIEKGVIPRGASLEAGNLDRGPIDELVVGDGYGDIVVLDQYNAHDVAFGSVERFAAGERAADVELADLNGDGMLDALIGDGYGDLIALEGAGESQFIDRIELPGVDVDDRGVDANALANGDFDGDGDQDIFVSGVSSETGYVLLNDGDGNFTAGPNFEIGREIRRAVSGDLNGDGFDDVVLQGEKSRVNGATGAVEVYLSNGDGSFTRSFLPLHKVTTVNIGDFDGDGDLDIAAARAGWNKFFTFENNGDGTFQGPRMVIAGDTLFGHMAVGDVDGDGKDDVVFTRQDNRFDVFLGDESDNLVNDSFTTTAAIGDEANDIALGDFNNDGYLDIVGAAGWRDRVEVLLGNGDATFAKPIESKTLDREIDSLATGDFNNDGNLDVALSGDGYGDLIVLYGAGDGSLDDEQRFIATDLGDGYGDVIVADFDGNGNDDVAVSIHEAPRWEDAPLQDVNIFINQGDVDENVNLDLGPSDLLDYTEDDGPQPLLPTVTVSGDTADGAVIEFLSGYTPGEDVLAFTSMFGITGMFDPDTGTLTLMGEATVAEYEAALRSITYENTSAAPSDTPRELEITIFNDDQSDTETAAVAVKPINDLPQTETADRTFTEDDEPLLLTPEINISDVDDTTLAFATVTITTNYTPGEDQLLFDADLADSLGLTVTVAEIMGGDALQLRVEGVADIADYEALLRTVAYFNPSQDPSDAQRTVEYVVNDGEDSSQPFPLALDVVPVNDATHIDPDGPTDPGPGDPTDPNDADPSDDDLDTIVFVENDPAVSLFPAVTLSDPDNDTLASATLTIDGWVSPEDIFAFDETLADELGLVVMTDVVDGVLTVTVTLESGDAADIEAFQDLLRSFTYENTSDDPMLEPRVAELTVNDGEDDSAPATRTIEIEPVNDIPVIDVAETLVFPEDSDPLAISPMLTIADPDSDTLQSATVLIASGFNADEDVLAWNEALASNLGIMVTVTDDGAGLLLTGEADLADYEALLRTVTYQNTSDNPADIDRRVEFTVNDGEDDSEIGVTTIEIDAENDAPQIDPDGPSEPGPGDPNDPNDSDPSDDDLDTIVFTENDPAVDLFPAIVLSDPDGDTLASSTLTIANWNPDEDVFGFDNLLANALFLDVTTQITEDGLVVTITGENGDAPIEAFQAVLRTFTYENTSDDPTLEDREASLVINDGQADSAPATRTIEIEPVNDAPELDVDAELEFPENSDPLAISPMLAISDVDSDTINSATVLIASGFDADQDVLGWNMALASNLGIMVTVTNDGAGLSLVGEADLADYEALLRSVTYLNTSDDPSDEARRVDFTVNDGEDDSETGSTFIEVLPENDAPEIDPDGPSDPGPGDPNDPNDADPSDDLLDPVVFIENDPETDLFPALEISDADGSVLADATVTITGWLTDQDVFGFDADLADSLGLTVTTMVDGDTLTVTIEPAMGDTADITAFQDLIRSLTYVNTSDDPSDVDRMASLTVSDAEGAEASIDRVIQVVPENDAPDIDLLTGPMVEVTVQGPSVPAGTDPTITVPIAANLIVSDADGDTLTRAQVRISDETRLPGDILVFTPIDGITGSYDAATGTLTLTGVASLDDYQTVLRSVTLTSTAIEVSTADQQLANVRDFSFLVFDDGELEGNDAVTYAITAEAGNQAPTLTMVDTFPGASGQGTTITYDELLAASDAADPDGDTILFRVESITNGALVSGGIELLPGSVIRPGDTITFIAPDSIGILEAFRIVAFDGELVSAPAVAVNFDLQEMTGEVQPLTPGSSVGRDGTENVAIANSFGEVLLFQDPDKSGEWTVVNLTESRGFPAVIGNVFTYVDTKDNATYAVGVALDSDDKGLLLFRQMDDGSWSMRDLSDELGVDKIRGGTVAAVEGPDGLVRISALSEDDNALLLFTQTGQADANGDFQYEFSNLFDDQLVPAGETLPNFQGQMISWVATWGAIHIAGVDDAGAVWGVWTAPALNGAWESDNLSEIADTPALDGAITVLVTPWQTFHITGVDTNGDLVATWWAPRFGGEWRLDNLTEQFGGPEIASGSLQAYSTDWGGLNYAAISTEGEAVVYWWSAQADTWTPTFVSDLAPEGENIRLESITGISGPFLTISLFGVGMDDSEDEGRELYAWFWDAETDAWTPQSLTDTAASLDATGGPLDDFAGDTI